MQQYTAARLQALQGICYKRNISADQSNQCHLCATLLITALLLNFEFQQGSRLIAQ